MSKTTRYQTKDKKATAFLLTYISTDMEDCIEKIHTDTQNYKILRSKLNEDGVSLSILVRSNIRRRENTVKKMTEADIITTVDARRITKVIEELGFAKTQDELLKERQRQVEINYQEYRKYLKETEGKGKCGACRIEHVCRIIHPERWSDDRSKDSE